MYPELHSVRRSSLGPHRFDLWSTEKELNFLCRQVFFEQLREKLRDGHKFLRESLKPAAAWQKRYYDRKADPREYQPGDWVFRYFAPDPNAKMRPKWDGPFEVIRNLGCVYELRTSIGVVRWHMDFLELVRTKMGELANIKNLDSAPEFSQLVEAGCDILRYKDGEVTVGCELPVITKQSIPIVGVKPPRRPRQLGATTLPKASAGDSGNKESGRETKGQSRKR